MNDRKNKLINLVQEILPTLTEVELSELFTHGLKLSGSCGPKDLNAIKTNDLINNFFDTHQQNSAESTLYNYRRLLTDFIHTNTSSISIETVNRYIKSKSWSENTLNRNTIVLKRFLAYLFEKQYIENNISQQLSVPKKVRKPQFFPSDNQIRDFIDKIKLVLETPDEILKYCILQSKNVPNFGRKLCHLIQKNQ